MREVALRKGVTMNQDGSGTYLTLARGFTGDELAGTVGRDGADALGIEGLPRGDAVRTAIGGRGWSRFKLDDAVAPAADLPDGVADWRRGGEPPEEWAGSAEARIVKPRRERTPIAHARRRTWAKRRTADAAKARDASGGSRA